MRFEPFFSEPTIRNPFPPFRDRERPSTNHHKQMDAHLRVRLNLKAIYFFRFSLLLPQQVFIQRQRLCMHLFGHGLAGFGRGGLFSLRRIGGGRRSPRPPENSAHMRHMLHMPKAPDVFLQKPSGVLPENVEIVGIGIDFCLSGLVRLPQNPLVHKDRHHF